MRGPALPLTLLLVVAAGALIGPAALAARPAEEAEVDPLALAAVLLDGGDADRALRVLAEVDPATLPVEGEVPPRGRFYTLRGLARLPLGQAAAAEDDLAKAARLLPERKPLRLHLARAAWEAGHPRAALTALDDAGPLAEQKVSWLGLRAECHLALDEVDAALRTLRRAWRRFGEPSLVGREVQLLVERGLTEAAVDRTRALFARIGEEPVFEVALGAVEELRKASAPGQAARLASQLRLLRPAAVEPRLAQARALADDGRPLAAALVYEQVSYLDPVHAASAAELYRRAGRLSAALLLNARVPDGATKVRQRFGLLVEAGRYEEAAALEPALARHGLLSTRKGRRAGPPAGDESVRWALGWALFYTGQLARADDVLKGVSDPALFSQATALRQRIAACRADPGLSRSCP